MDENTSINYIESLIAQKCVKGIFATIIQKVVFTPEAIHMAMILMENFRRIQIVLTGVRG